MLIECIISSWHSFKFCIFKQDFTLHVLISKTTLVFSKPSLILSKCKTKKKKKDNRTRPEQSAQFSVRRAGTATGNTQDSRTFSSSFSFLLFLFFPFFSGLTAQPHLSSQAPATGDRNEHEFVLPNESRKSRRFRSEFVTPTPRKSGYLYPCSFPRSFPQKKSSPSPLELRSDLAGFRRRRASG
jgi:hypothetical protein